MQREILVKGERARGRRGGSGRRWPSVPRLVAPITLRRYQLEPYLAILRAAEAHDAGTVVVRMSRQAGKNELSAHVEGALLASYRGSPRRGVKAAPTQSPQATRSLRRLSQFLRSCDPDRALGRVMTGGDTVQLGEASWWFGSGEPGANVVGDTADLLLEFDEAQDFDIEKHDREYRPMAAATACASAYYGTAWTDFDLLETTRQAALEQQARDGARRVFDVPWSRVAEEAPKYGLFVEAERVRLGHTVEHPNPVFQTQYDLITVAGAGRLFTPAHLDQLAGEHPALETPGGASHNTYVAGVDVGGEDMSEHGDPDETVVTIGRARWTGRGRREAPMVEAVAQYAMRGLRHEDQRADVLRILRSWRVSFTTIDATGIGEPLAAHLIAQLGATRVNALKLTRQSKSSLGYELLAGAGSGSLKLWKGARSEVIWQQARLARRELKPGGFMLWYVDERDGHDDRLMSLALMNNAASRGKAGTASEARWEVGA